MKYSSDEGFVEHKIELGDEDLEEILRECLGRHADLGRPYLAPSRSGLHHDDEGRPVKAEGPKHNALSIRGATEGRDWLTRRTIIAD